MRSITRFWAAAGQAGLAELAWHLLGPAWAFGLAVAMIAWHLPYKAASVENRVNGLVPQVAAAKNTAAGAQSTANTANSTANTANSTANTANNRVGNLSGRSTSTNGLADGTINGYSSTEGLPDGTLTGSSGQINTGGGTAHTHGPGSYSVTNGQHRHGVASSNGYAVGSGQHSHSLPNV